MSNSEPMLPPGFRFHPTDEELILHYLKNRANSVPIPVSIVAEIDIYKFDPWDLPAHALFGDREWYFFSPRDRKYPNGVRPNRAARSGYWKATGTDKPIVSSSGGNEKIGVKKALVFYRGKPPKGAKTNWIMHEYRLPESPNSSSKIYQHIPIKNRDSSSMRLDDWVLCRIYKKSNNQNLDAPSADREMEDSIIEDTYLSSFPELSTQQSNFKIPKTGSLSEFLEDNDYSMLTRFLYDNSPAVLSQEQQAGFVLSNPTTSMTNQTTTGFHNINPQIPVSIFGFDDSTNPVKRQRSSDAYFEEEEEENSTGVLLHPSKKHDSSSCVRINFSNQQITGTPNSNYFDHQFLMNSHPELH